MLTQISCHMASLGHNELNILLTKIYDAMLHNNYGNSDALQYGLMEWAVFEMMAGP